MVMHLCFRPCFFLYENQRAGVTSRIARWGQELGTDFISRVTKIPNVQTIVAGTHRYSKHQAPITVHQSSNWCTDFLWKAPSEVQLKHRSMHSLAAMQLVTVIMVHTDIRLSSYIQWRLTACIAFQLQISAHEVKSQESLPITSSH